MASNEVNRAGWPSECCGASRTRRMGSGPTKAKAPPRVVGRWTIARRGAPTRDRPWRLAAPRGCWRGCCRCPGWGHGLRRCARGVVPRGLGLPSGQLALPSALAGLVPHVLGERRPGLRPPLAAGDGAESTSDGHGPAPRASRPLAAGVPRLAGWRSQRCHCPWGSRGRHTRHKPAWSGGFLDSPGSPAPSPQPRLGPAAWHWRAGGAWPATPCPAPHAAGFDAAWSPRG